MLTHLSQCTCLSPELQNYLPLATQVLNTSEASEAKQFPGEPTNACTGTRVPKLTIKRNAKWELGDKTRSRARGQSEETYLEVS
jgi:hypothetical protein